MRLLVVEAVGWGEGAVEMLMGLGRDLGCEDG